EPEGPGAERQHDEDPGRDRRPEGQGRRDLADADGPAIRVRAPGLGGPTKGTKQSHTYVPMGNKTKVIVAGDFHLQGASDEDTRKGALAYFEQVFNEDSAALKDF